MNILFLVPYVPNLIRVRPYNLIRHLTYQGHQVTLATLWTGERDQEDLKHLEQICHETYVAPLPTSKSLVNSLVALPSRSPLQANYCWQPSLKEQLMRLLSTGKTTFDVVHVEHLRGVRYALELNPELRKREIPLVWDSVDSISMLFKQAAGSSSSFFGRFLGWFEAGRTERYEGWLVNQFDRILVTSRLDKKTFVSLNQEADEIVSVLPNGVDLDYFSPDPSVVREPASLVVSGKMSYHANVTMVIHLVEKIMPQIWEKRPDVKLYIVGKDPTKELKSMAKDLRIVVTGTVEDIRPYLRRATVSVTPILYGAGIQNKVLEAMACATPVVSSPQAVSALSLNAGQDVITAQDPKEFAQAVLCLLDNPSLRKEVGEAGHRYVESNHKWAKIVENLVDLYSEAKNRRGQFN